MGKLNIFEITLTNFNGVYFAGQNLEGHVTVELNDGMKMRGKEDRHCFNDHLQTKSEKNRSSKLKL